MASEPKPARSYGWLGLRRDERRRFRTELRSGRTPPAPRLVELELVGDQIPVGWRRPLEEMAALSRPAIRLRVGPAATTAGLRSALDLLDALDLRRDWLVVPPHLVDRELAWRLLDAAWPEITGLFAGVSASDHSRVTGRPGTEHDEARRRFARLASMIDPPRTTLLSARFDLDRWNLRELPEMFWLGRDLGAERIEIEAVAGGARFTNPGVHPLSERDGDLLHPLLDLVFADPAAAKLELHLPFPAWRVLLRRHTRTEEDRPVLHPGVVAALLAWHAATLGPDGDLTPASLVGPARWSETASAWHRSWRGRPFRHLRRELRAVALSRGRLLRARHRLSAVAPGLLDLDPDEAEVRHLARAGPLVDRLADTLDQVRPGWPLRAESVAFRAWHRLRRPRSPEPSSTSPTPRPMRLHVGSGNQRLAGWINLDWRALPAVDLVADVTDGLPFGAETLDAVFAEHFLEHLGADDALRFLDEISRVLRPEGAVRLSTPNLDWVWASQYAPTPDHRSREEMALSLNRAFYGWRHRFLWNRELLASALAACGFTEIHWSRYRESERVPFVGIERHETYGEGEGLEHVLVVEARPGARRDEARRELTRLFEAEFLEHVRST